MCCCYAIILMFYSIGTQDINNIYAATNKKNKQKAFVRVNEDVLTSEIVILVDSLSETSKL